MTETPTNPLPLMFWLSPAFPVGSFAYSHGLEWAVESGAVHDRASAEAWLGDLVGHGGLRNDAILLAAVWQAARAEDAAGLATANELALASAGSRERYLETSAQGNAFLLTITAAWPVDGIADSRTGLAGDVAYPVAVGLVTARHGIGLEAALSAFVANGLANLVSALVRLNAIGQTDGQHVIAALMPAISGLALYATGSTLDDLGGAAFQSDIAAMRHETQYTRLFRS